ncbi:hypothetical protein BN134_1349 [Cronobacter dublinensis 1210]|uniref:Uncharacterized protein n=1 Tax=Cronobacter dublinensis 1210 TaxID=1208656 RepID=A0ABM9Q5E7_9ENTR|nr:hypothetical protein BN134_1349 [Cronobacter dublinensis 1210]
MVSCVGHGILRTRYCFSASDNYSLQAAGVGVANLGIKEP